MKAKVMAWIERVLDPRGDGDGSEGRNMPHGGWLPCDRQERLEELHPPGIEKDQSDFGRGG